MSCLLHSRLPRRLLPSFAFLCAAVLTAGACAHKPGPFVWVDQVAETEISPAVGVSRLGVGDLVGVQVFNHPELSGRTRVREDGNLSIPLLGDVRVTGQTTAELARAVEQQLGSRGLAVAARTTVTIEERAPLRVAVLGEVARPGMFALEPGAGVAEALASAGGLTEFAHRDRVYVVRRTPAPVRIRLRYQDVSGGTAKAAQLRLRPSDVIVVE
jgi:polysaccharide export outer membrane protein